MKRDRKLSVDRHRHTSVGGAEPNAGERIGRWQMPIVRRTRWTRSRGSLLRVPELGPLLDEHLEDNGELLVYMAFERDFLRWFIDRVRAGDSEPARRFVGAIEPLMTTDVDPAANDPVWNLAGVCFVEGLQNDRDVVDAARPWMGPSTSKAFELIG